MPQLRRQELHQIWQLIGECRELGDDASYWMSHLGRRLSARLNAGPVMAGEAGHHPGQMPENLGAIDVGWERGFNRQGWVNALQEFARAPDYHPVLWRSLIGAQTKNIAVNNRPMTIGDRKWYRCHAYDISARIMGTDDIMVCAARIPTGPHDVQMLVINRPAKEATFSEHDREFARQVIIEIAPLIGGPLAGFREQFPSRLSPRCREVLACLLEGDSDRQIARRLGLSPYTINQYVKSIFRHFHVCSRTELMARWIRRGWGGKFAWRSGLVPVVETVPT